jgi:hypothetical protein
MSHVEDDIVALTAKEAQALAHELYEFTLQQLEEHDGAYAVLERVAQLALDRSRVPDPKFTVAG